MDPVIATVRAGKIELRVPKLRRGSYFPNYLELRRMAAQQRRCATPAWDRIPLGGGHGCRGLPDVTDLANRLFETKIHGAEKQFHYPVVCSVPRAGLPALRHAIAQDCPRIGSMKFYDQCSVVYPVLVSAT